MRPLKRLTAYKFGVILCCILVWVAAGLAADSGPWPARDWNLRTLKRIKVPPGPSLTFAVLGDNRSNPEVFTQVLQHMDQEPGLAFAIDVGDLVESGSRETFGQFLTQVRQHLRLPLLTAIGNHDLDQQRNSTLYRRIFGPDYYAFHFKDNYFIVVNDVAPQGIGPRQWRWLEANLKKSQAYQTRLVFLHTPLFDPRGGEHHHCLSEETARKFLALFRQYHVTHIFAGHIHSYFSGNWDGVPYTISAGGGAPLYGSDPAHFFYHYLKVTLQEGQVHIEVRRLAAPGR
ncbi:MAG: metallophosphoesterase [Desulfobaccales bacterium]